MYSRSAYTALAMPLVEGDGEQDVRCLRSSVSDERFIGCPLKVRILQINICVTVTGGRYVDEPGSGSHQERYPVDEKKVTQVISTELSFKTVGGMPKGCGHHAGVCDYQVERFTFGYEFLGTITHALQIGEIELYQLKASPVLRRVPSNLSGCSFRLSQIANGTHNMCAMRC
jgi:hypothetical protein